MTETTIRQGFNGEIAVKSAENVTAYQWWVHNPAAGGYPATEAEVADWPETALAVPERPSEDVG